jgi:hypothetical protein
MKLKNLSISIATLAVLSGLLLGTAAAVTFPNVPATPVTMTVADGNVSYFVITLSNVPAGYDVLNGEYLGWCLDRGHTMSRSVALTVTLYSSLSPPVSLNTKPWNQINYVLNNKQGTVEDVAEAIWHFMGWWYFEHLSPTAKTLVNEANAHSDFVPAFGQIVGVICLPADANQQIALIEVKPCARPGLSPGYWKHNVNVYNGGHGSYSGDPHITPTQLEAYAAYIKANFEPSFSLAWAQTRFQNNQYKNMWLTIANWFNAAAGLAPYIGD